MKYYILINQLILSKTELDIVDGAILDYIYFYCNSQNEKIKKQRITDEDGEIWTWIDYSTLLKDMPMLNIKENGAITRRVIKIEKAGYIKTKRFQHMKKYFRMTAKSDGLLIQINRVDDLLTQVNSPIDTGQQGFSPNKTNPIDTGQPIKNIKNKDINKNMQSTDCKNDTNLLLEEFKDVNPSYERFFGNKTQRAALDRLIKKYSAKKVKEIIKSLPATNEKKFFPTITTPYELEQKLSKLAYAVKSQKNNNGITVI